MAAPFSFGWEKGWARVSVVDRLRQRIRGEKKEREAAAEIGERKTQPLPGVLMPWRTGPHVRALPKATPQNLRRFAELPYVRRAVNLVKDRIASMEWEVRLKRHAIADTETPERIRMLRRVFDSPNPQDSFRILAEQVLEDVIVGGFGAVEIECTGDRDAPVRLWPVDGATIQMNAQWDGSEHQPRYAQVTGRFGEGAMQPLLDRELMYVRLNTRTHTPFGLGRVEVAFDTVNQFLQAHRYAAKLANNSVVQYALWLDETTPVQQERLIRWWRDEVEGTAQVPILSTETKPEVLRFGGGTDADLRLKWQEFLLRVMANAFDLPPMMLGLESDVNRSTAEEMSEQAFQTAVMPVASLFAEHITRDVLGKALGMDDYEFVFLAQARDESAEVDLQIKLLGAGVLTVDEVRAMRGLGKADEMNA